MDLADESLAAAEVPELRRVFTLDNDCRVYRIGTGRPADAFEIVPLPHGRSDQCRAACSGQRLGFLTSAGANLRTGDCLMDDLHLLLRNRDGPSSLYVEHARVDRHEKSIAV